MAGFSIIPSYPIREREKRIKYTTERRVADRKNV